VACSSNRLAGIGNRTKGVPDLEHLLSREGANVLARHKAQSAQPLARRSGGAPFLMLPLRFP
jgi:hypothetical protein